MGRLWYYLSDDGDVVAEARKAPDQVRADLAELLDRLIVNPKDGRVGVMELRGDDWPAYTAPFDRAILLFSLTADYPCIRLLQITWLDDPPY